MSPAPKAPWGARAVAALALLTALAGVTGFILLPGSDPLPTLWQRICRSAGVTWIRADSRALPADSTLTRVVVPASLRGVGTAEQIGLGATVGQRCAVCHKSTGAGIGAAPVIAGQYAAVIYKQLLDYQNGSRRNAAMNALAATLTPAEVTDLAFYFASLPALVDTGSLRAAPALVRVGDPMRNIAPCASCHGLADHHPGSPRLAGEPRAYLQEQLAAFARGARNNDPNAIMRSVAHGLSAAEITRLAGYYAGLGH